uniref:Uncharacterized protein n=1 Tax=Rhizophora mucronata TaxID=61149 RepID=A0A2P2N4S7_RHIMU
MFWHGLTSIVCLSLKEYLRLKMTLEILIKTIMLKLVVIHDI